MKRDGSVFLCIAVGLVFFVVGVYVTFFRNMGMVETTAEITNIEAKSSGDSVTHHTYVKYTVNDVEYTDVKLDTWASTYRVGKKITVYYDPDDPSEAHGKSLVTGIICMVCGSISLCAPLLNRRRT